jgi:methionyl-tRNA formyltransferase
MKVLLISGSHSRHFYIHKAIIDRFDVIGAVVMNREEELPQPPEGITEHDKSLFERHFKKRFEVETEAYNRLSFEDTFSSVDNIRVEPDQLNTQRVADFVASKKADICIIFGPDIIKGEVFDNLPKYKLNVHLGLSPWYRGSATLFWPFYNLEPQMAGATIHQISLEADAGEIVHQCIPKLEKGDGIHDVAARVVKQVTQDTLKILESFQEKGELPFKKQKSTGRLYLTNDFKPEHLRVIYDLYDNNIVDAWLDGELNSKVRRLINFFEA